MVTEPTPESVRAMADQVVEDVVVPKKIPDVADTDGQASAVSGALASALLTATDIPLHMLQPVVSDLANQLVALGIRQTEHIDPSALHAPSWITDGVRQQAVPVPDQPDPTAEEPVVARTAKAPQMPKRLTKVMRAAQ